MNDFQDLKLELLTENMPVEQAPETQAATESQLAEAGLSASAEAGDEECHLSSS